MQIQSLYHEQDKDLNAIDLGFQEELEKLTKHMLTEITLKEGLLYRGTCLCPSSADRVYWI